MGLRIFITVLVALVSTCNSYKTGCTDRCLNRGKCTWNGSGFYCVCFVGYYGNQCEYGFGGYPNAETTVMTGVVTPKQTTPLVGEDPHPDVVMAVLYAAIALLIISFTVLTIRYRRQYKTLRLQHTRTRMEGVRRSHQIRDLELANEATTDGPYSTVVMLTAPIQPPPPYKELSPTLYDCGHVYDEPPPYEVIVALDDRVDCGGDILECDAV